MAVLIGVAIILVFLLLASYGIRSAWRSRGELTGQDGTGPPILPPGGVSPQNADQGFMAHNHLPGGSADPGFTVLSVTGEQSVPPHGYTPKARPAHAADFNFVEITENPTAICKYSGRQVGKCTCDKHRAKR